MKQVIHLTWKPPSAGFLEINYDGSHIDQGVDGGVDFIIRDSNKNLLAAGRSHIYDTNFPMAGLCVA